MVPSAWKRTRTSHNWGNSPAPSPGGSPKHTEGPTGVRKNEVFATYVGSEESLGDSEGPDGIRTRHLSVKSRLPVRIGSGPADWRRQDSNLRSRRCQRRVHSTGLPAIAGPGVEPGSRGYEPRGLPLPYPAPGNEENSAAGSCSSPDLNRGLDRERVVSLAPTPLERWPRPRGHRPKGRAGFEPAWSRYKRDEGSLTVASVAR